MLEYEGSSRELPSISRRRFLGAMLTRIQSFDRGLFCSTNLAAACGGSDGRAAEVLLRNPCFDCAVQREIAATPEPIRVSPVAYRILRASWLETNDWRGRAVKTM
jgi:hypothetical protein